jgi:hypothetical protein
MLLLTARYNRTQLASATSKLIKTCVWSHVVCIRYHGLCQLRFHSNDKVKVDVTVVGFNHRVRQGEVEMTAREFNNRWKQVKSRC